MNDNEYYKSCDHCGRPMIYCKGRCCGKTQGCQCKEYGPKVCGAIRPGEPRCPYQAVIPTLTVETTSSLKDLADCFVHVSDINTTFYIDDKHRMIVTWAGPVEVDDYDYENNPLNLRSQTVYDFANNRAVVYNKTGGYKIIPLGVGSAEPTVFTMQCEVSDSSAMPGWYGYEGLKEKIGETYGTPAAEFYKTTYAYDTLPEYPVTFLNEKTGDVITPTELYALLVNGEDVIINHVPVVRASGEWGDSVAYINGVRLTKVVMPSPYGESPYDTVIFGGSTYATTTIPVSDYVIDVRLQLGFTIRGEVEDGLPVYGMMTVDGVETRGY